MPDIIDSPPCLFASRRLIPNAITVIIVRIMNYGGQVYIAGGAVRQILLNLPIKDWDLATSLHPDTIESIFSDMPTALTGRKFGTITVISDNIPVEITTFRTEEKYTDLRHPDRITYVSDIYKDLSRRDFSINAIAYNPYLIEPLVDPFDGCADLAQGTIKTVGNAQERFSEDPLRIIRCIRFLSELGFVVNEQTYDAVCQFSPLLAQIPRERIREEFNRILLAPHVSDGLSMLVKTGILKVVLPDLSFSLENNGSAIYKAVSLCGSDIILRLAALFYHTRGSEHTVENSLKSLRYDNYSIKTIMKILSHSELTWLNEHENLKYHLRKLLNHVGAKDAYRILDLLFAHVISRSSICSSENNVQTDKSRNSISAESVERCRISLTEVLLDPVKLSDLAINGHDLINAGFGADNGVELGNALKKALDFVHRNPELNKKDLLLEKLKAAQVSYNLNCIPAITNTSISAEKLIDKVE